ncbi:MAG TPA: precorrin-3B synthase [Pilimelia sp.]|nr:precorrin-3B synthase [Pilimelia sp.]
MGPQSRHADDRCPGALRVHEAADGGLIRVRVPGGRLRTAQWHALAEASRTHAAGGWELTGRANVQVRGLRPDAAAAMAADLAAAGLLPSAAHDRVRNIVASPLTGRDGAGHLDARPLVAALDRGLTGDPTLTALPGRFLFGVDDGRGDLLALRPDALAYATGADEVALWFAGVDSGLRVPAPLAPGALVAAAHAFLAERAAQGSRAWRVEELAGGGRYVAERLAVACDAAATRHPPAPTPPTAAAGHGPLGPVRQRDGRVAVAAAVPLGRLSDAQARLLGALAAGELVVTPWRSVVLPDLPDDAAATDLAAAGLVLDPASPWVGVTACAGTGCAKALADVRDDARRVHGGHGVRGPAHWSGCGRRCGRPPGAVWEMVAGDGGYRYEGAAATGTAVAAALRRNT